MKVNWKPIRKIGAAFVAFLASGTGVTLVNDLATHVSPFWASLIVGVVTVVTGYLVPDPAVNQPPAAPAPPVAPAPPAQ